MTAANLPPSRILVGAGSFVDAAAALRIAERLAADLSADLGGVLIEEVATLAICEIPNQRVVLTSGATVLAPDRSQVRALMNADARAFEQSLVRTAKTNGAKWIFAQETGDLVGTALRAAVGWDILVIGYRKFHAVRGTIIVFREDDAPNEDMETAAGVLARRLSVDQIVFSVGAEDGKRAFREAGRPYQYKSFQDSLNALARTNAEAVFIDLLNGPVRGPDDLARLLEVARCPLILFGTSKIGEMPEHRGHISTAQNDGDPTDEH